MRKEELISLINTLLPKLYEFSFALMGDELHSEQLVVDSYTVFIVGDAQFLRDEEYDIQNKQDRKRLKKYLFTELLKGIFELGIKRATPLKKAHLENLREFESFYKLSLKKRALVYLKEVAGFSVVDLQKIFLLERYQVIELYHHAKYEIISDKSSFGEVL